MPFFYDRISGQTGISQFMNYINNQIYINELHSTTDDILNYQLIEIRRAIGRNSEQSLANMQSIEIATQKVCGSLERGFKQIISEVSDGFEKVSGQLDDVNWRLNEVNEELLKLHSMLDWKTDLLLEGQKITNAYLGKIQQLLQIPDSQKQRSYHVEKGLTYLKNAIEEGPNSDFYEDALDEFSKALEIEAKDYFSLHKVGLIHLNSIRHLDISKAKDYFKSSARYAKAESRIKEVASSLNYASRCYYILDNLSDAIETAKQAFYLEMSNAEYGMQLAKCLSANGNEIEAADVLKNVIELDKYYAVKTLADHDLISKSAIQNMLSIISDELISKVNAEIDNLKSIIIENSRLRNDLMAIEKLIKDKIYLNARTAAEMLF